jgi:hypothetical protein
MKKLSAPDPMPPEKFRAQRRQKFLTLEYYILNQEEHAESIALYLEGIKNKADDDFRPPVRESGVFGDHLDLLKLHYTAGVPIEELQPLYDKVIAALKVWQEAHLVYIKSLEDYPGELPDISDVTPLYFEGLETFQPVMDITSLGLLLGDAEALRQLAYWLRRYRHEDMLFEELISPAISDPDLTCEKFFIELPYTYLIDAFIAKEPKDAIKAMKQYLDKWYKSFEGVPWHDGHLYPVQGEYMPYYGYWSFESAAIAVLHNMDDSSFRNHLLYPKDLADWARENNSIEKIRASLEEKAPPSVPGGSPCTKAGRWATPAQPGSARNFEEGEIMPDFPGSSYGATFWQWVGPADKS